MRSLSIGKLARAAGVSIDTVRFYEKSGLLSPAARRPSGFREYSELDVRQLVFIRRARHLDFSIDEIGELLRLNAGSDFERITVAIARKRALVDARIAELQQWRQALDELQQLAGTPTRDRILDSFERCARSPRDVVAAGDAALADDRERDESSAAIASCGCTRE